jgi:tRNA pseudouridine55 synthase
VLVVDKPAGPTSHDVVALVRRRLHGAKVGHTGTLDPFATGVLPLVVGRATRLARYLGGGDKEYDATIRLGRATDTHDITGRVVFEAPATAPLPSQEAVRAVLGTFRGTWLQKPPAFSAKMAAGVRAYEHARRGESVELAPVPVTVSRLEMLSMEASLVRVRLVSSAGFYVRAFAHDVGDRLGVGACLEALRRTRSGTFALEDAVTLDRLAQPGLEARMMLLENLLADWPVVLLTAEGTAWVGHGRDLGPSQYRGDARAGSHEGLVRIVGPDGLLAGIGEISAGGVLHPSVVLM